MPRVSTSAHHGEEAWLELVGIDKRGLWVSSTVGRGGHSTLLREGLALVKESKGKSERERPNIRERVCMCNASERELSLKFKTQFSIFFF